MNISSESPLLILKECKKNGRQTVPAYSNWGVYMAIMGQVYAGRNASQHLFHNGQIRSEHGCGSDRLVDLVRLQATSALERVLS